MVRILITNDDGYQAEGIRLLQEAARVLSDDVWVIAPEVEQSGCGHGVTLHRPLYIQKQSERAFVINGTPTDCVMLAINEIMKDDLPELVLSGVNRGANLGDDVTYSGTIAACFEAKLSGIPAIAFSQHYWDVGAVPWWVTKKYAPILLKELGKIKENLCLNINLPALASNQTLKGIKTTCLGKRKIGGNLISHLDEFNQQCFTIGKRRIEDNTVEGTDIHAVYDGYISMTPLTLDLTDRNNKVLERLQGIKL